MRLELKKIQAENAALAQKVQAGRESIAQTEHRISTTVDEWKVRETQLKIYIYSTCLFLHSQRGCMCNKCKAQLEHL